MGRLAHFFCLTYKEAHRIAIDEREKNCMFFYDKELEKEYTRLSTIYPDLPEIQPPLMNVSDALRAYFALADYFMDKSSEYTETMLVGLRSDDLLYSALGRQVVSFGGKAKYTNAIDVCSTLFFGMVKNHSFSDGNKRTALLLLLYQLDRYGYYPCCSVKEYERLVVAVAANTLSTKYNNTWKKYKKFDDVEVRTISHLLRNMTKKKDHSYHLKITFSSMIKALEKHGVSSEIAGGKIHLKRSITQGHSIFKTEKKLKYTCVFGGWTRCIGPQTARDMLTALELYNQFPDYQAFIGGEEPYYMLIQNFEGPLRRLKDE